MLESSSRRLMLGREFSESPSVTAVVYGVWHA